MTNEPMTVVGVAATFLRGTNGLSDGKLPPL
jgi:hypothetical protein